MVLLFKGIAPPSQFPATIASGAPPRPNHAVFKAELVYVSKPFGGARGGEGVCTTCTTSFSKKKKKALSAHYVPTTCAHTTMVHRVQERAACPSWGAPPWGPETWVMEVVELKEVKEGGLKALVRGTIKVVLLFARHIACRTGSFLCGLKWAEMLHHPCILGGPQRQGGQNQNRWGPQVGGNATSPLHSRGSPKRGGQNQNRWSPQVGGNATSQILHSQGSPTKRTK